MDPPAQGDSTLMVRISKIFIDSRPLTVPDAPTPVTATLSFDPSVPISYGPETTPQYITLAYVLPGDPEPMPEPSTASMTGLAAVVAIMGFNRRRKNRQN